MSKKTTLTILTFSAIFLLSLRVNTDSDFGWHLRVGEYILKHRTIPTTDIFSFSQPSYPYVYHSWAAELFTYASYQLLGFVGTTIFFSTVLTAGLFIVYKTTQLLTNSHSTLFFLWMSPLAFSIVGSRSRSFGFLFLALTYYLFLKLLIQNSKLIWVTPLVFFLWANFHGSFVLGIATFAIMIISSRLFRKINADQLKTLTIILTLSALATFLNPYLHRAWQQALIMSFNSYFNLQPINPDWQPLINLHGNGWIFAFLVLTIILLTFFFKIKIDIFQKFLIILFFLLSLFTSRFIIALFVFLISPANQLILNLKDKLGSQTINSLPVRSSFLAAALILPLFALQNILEVSFAYSSLKNYNIFLAENSPNRFTYAVWPYEASFYLEKNLLDKKILSEGNWSGLLLLQNPQFKLFWWGAMDNFIVDGHSFAFEYLDLIHAQPGWETKLAKYQVDVVFLPPNFPLVKNLKSNPNWQTAYEDDQATILVKISN